MTRAVARSNLDVVLQTFAHFRENGELDPDLLHPEFVWDMSHYTGWPEQQTYPGVEGAMRFLSDWIDAWDDWEWEVRSIQEAEDGIVAILHQAGCSKSTGVAVEMDFAQVMTLAEGLIMRVEVYSEPEAALDAAGLAQ